MSFAKDIEGYETTVGGVKEHLTSGKFLPMGDPAKAAKVMIDIVENENPPLHLVLGSEAAAILKATDERRKEEFEKWLDVTVSTDHDDAVNIFETEYGKQYLAHKGISLE